MSEVDFGNRLRKFRSDRNRSMRQTAHDAGISVSYLSKLESNEGNPTLDVLTKLAELYGVSLQELTQDVGPTATSLPLEPSLEGFIGDYRHKFPELDEQDWKGMLNNIRLRGTYPQNSEDWLAIFLDIRRAVSSKG